MSSGIAMSSMRHRMAAPAHFSRQCTARAAPRSPPAWPAASQRSCVHAQQRRRAVAAADAATAAGAAAGLLQPLLAAAAPPALGSSQQLLRGGLELPPPALVLEVLGGCAGAAAAALAVAKLVLCDQLDIELHRGRLYLQYGVDSSGPPLPPGAVITRPTGTPRGNGAFAAAPIPGGSRIADYTGELLDNAAFFARYPDGAGDYAMAIDQEFVIDAAAHVGDAAFHPVHINHSAARANVARFYRRRDGRVSLFARRDIAPGEELLLDYGRRYWRGREHLELP